MVGLLNAARMKIVGSGLLAASRPAAGIFALQQSDVEQHSLAFQVTSAMKIQPFSIAVAVYWLAAFINLDHKMLLAE